MNFRFFPIGWTGENCEIEMLGPCNKSQNPCGGGHTCVVSSSTTHNSHVGLYSNFYVPLFLKLCSLCMSLGPNQNLMPCLSPPPIFLCMKPTTHCMFTELLTTEPWLVSILPSTYSHHLNNTDLKHGVLLMNEF